MSPQSRAQQLAEVAVAVYEAGCSAIPLPLESSNPLLAILKQALEKEGAEQSVGQALATALLESVLQAVDTEADSFPPLIVSPRSSLGFSDLVFLVVVSCSAVLAKHQLDQYAVVCFSATQS